MALHTIDVEYMTCDGCGVWSDYFDTRNSRQWAKQNSWAVVEGESGEEKHYCPDCAKKILAR